LAKAVSDDSDGNARRRFHSDHRDFNWFQQGRNGLVCGFRFMTGEVNLTRSFELAQLRNALSDIKRNAEAYVIESQKACQSLAKLSVSLQALQALQALKLYRKA